MNIRFDKIVIDNFLSIGHGEVDLDNNGYVTVKGINNNPDDFATSNGAGKSSVFEAISWVLTGETVRGIKNDVVNINGDDGAVVEIHFSVDGDDWIIQRSREHSKFKTNLKIWKNGEDKSGKGIRDTEKLLAEYFPDLTSSLVGSVIILGQGLPQRFTNNTPSGRKEVLEKLSKSDFMIADLKDRIKHRAEELSKIGRDLSDSYVALTTEKSVAERSCDALGKELSKITDTSVLVEKANEIRAKLSDDKETYEKYTIKRNDLDSKSEELSKSFVEKHNKYTEDLSELVKQESEETLSVSNSHAESLSKLSEQKARLESEILRLTKEIKKIDSIVDVCPTCGQKLVGVEKPDSSDLRKELLSLREELEGIVAEISSERDAQSKECEEIRTKYKDKKASLYKDYEEDTKELSEEITTLKARVSKADRIISDLHNTIVSEEKELSQVEADISSHDLTVKTLLEKIEKEKTVILEIDQKLSYNINEREITNLRIEAVSKFNTAISRDFRGVLLSSVIDFISERSVYYSKAIFDTDKITFELDGNNIGIGYCGKQYESLSGGERQKVDLIVQLSIRDMLCRFLGFSCNILVLDEIFDNLDMVGCQKVINLISTKLPDINSIYIVTHHGDLEIPYDRKLIVEKNDKGVSTVNVILH